MSTSAERMRLKRERDKLDEEERLARLLSRTIRLDLFKATDAKLVEVMDRADIDEPQDLITRLIHGASRMSDDELQALITM
jgi:hypothetical protein